MKRVWLVFVPRLTRVPSAVCRRCGVGGSTHLPTAMVTCHLRERVEGLNQISWYRQLRASAPSCFRWGFTGTSTSSTRRALSCIILPDMIEIDLPELSTFSFVHSQKTVVRVPADWGAPESSFEGRGPPCCGECPSFGPQKAKHAGVR